MDQTANHQVTINYNGDFCADCPLCAFETERRAVCFGFFTQKGHPKSLRVANAYLENAPPEYLVKKPKPALAAKRHPECVKRYPSFGANRTPQKGTRLYPTPRQLIDGAAAPCANYHDLCDVLQGYKVIVQYGYYYGPEKDQIGMVSGFFTLVKGRKKIDLGNNFQLCLEGVPFKARTALYRWAGEIQDEILDIENTVMEEEWDRLNPHG